MEKKDGVSLKIVIVFSLIFVFIIIGLLIAIFANLNDNNANENGKSSSILETIQESVISKNVTIKESPDKYTWYIKNYVGKNCASFGYVSLMNDRREKYGWGTLTLILVKEDGSFVDFSNEEDLKNYVVISQSYEPNTEFKYSFLKDSDGKEYDNLVDTQSIEEIVLGVKNVNDKKSEVKLNQITQSPDKYTWYIKDYSNRNCASFGYVSLMNDRRDKYGWGNIKIIFSCEDGSFVDFSNEEELKKYVVVSQNITYNTELKLEYSKDTTGKEYDNLVSSQNIDEIELIVKKIVD